MANDITTIRSNVFQVTDIDKFKKIMDKVYTYENEIEVVIDNEKEKKYPLVHMTTSLVSLTKTMKRMTTVTTTSCTNYRP